MKEKDLSGFEELTGITFEDKNLLKQAFTHRSFLNENERPLLSVNFWDGQLQVQANAVRLRTSIVQII